MPQFKPGTPSNRRRLFAAGVVVLLAAIAFLTFRDWMTYRRLGKETEQLTQQIARERHRRDVELPKAREHLIELEDEQQHFRYPDRLPDEDRLEELFDRFSEFEEISQVDWEESRSTEPRGSPRGSVEPYQRIQYTFDMTGDFFSFCKFINLVENMVRFATIDEFTIKRDRRASEESGGLVCDIKLTFSVYMLKASPGPSPAAPRGGGVRTARS